MRTLMLWAAALAVVLAVPGPAEARFDDREARHACKKSARGQYGARDFHDLTVSNRGSGTFVVTGNMVRRNGTDRAFTCTWRDGRITSLALTGGGDDGDSVGAAIGAALGVAVGAAILGAISSDHRHDDYRAPEAPAYDGGRSYSPARNITCYPRQQACYYKGDRLAPDWTDREFGRGGGAPSGISERDMRRYCQGEAASRFNRRPRDIVTQGVERARGRRIVNGRFDARGGRSAYFRCTFSADGRFLGIQRT